MSLIEREPLMLSFWECGHIEVDDGTAHACDGRDVCVAKWVNYVPADQLRGAVATLRDLVEFVEALDSKADDFGELRCVAEAKRIIATAGGSRP